MFKSKKFIVFLFAVSMGIAFCHAAEKTKLIKGLEDDEDELQKSSWFGIGFFTPMQLPDEESAVKVFRLSTIYTYNRAVSGLDVGILCYSGDANGMQAAWSNHADGIMNGLTIGLFNIAEVEMNGMQLGLYNRAGSDSENVVASKKASSVGLQWGWANCADAIFSGWQLGITNVSTTLFKGVQIGAVNISQEPDKAFDEFQSEKYKKGKGKKSCIQIGVINFNPNGFLPVTLLVNF
jgi:hypothetical protein